MLNMRLARPELVVDITRVAELGHLAGDSAGALHMGAAVRQAAAATDSAFRRGWPLLSAAIEQIGHPQIRNRGTVCGSLVHHDPAAELPAVAVALDARFTVAGPGGTRTVPAEGFFLSTFAADVEPDELLTEVVFPAGAPATGWSFLELIQRRGDFAGVGVAVLVRRSGDAVSETRIVFCGVGSTPVRVPEAEQTLVGRAFDADAVQAAVQAVRGALDPPGDVHASAQWRREGAEVLLRRALEEALKRSA